MGAPYAGGCLCAAVRYRVDAEPLTLYACHCMDCQRRTGSGFAMSLVVRREALVVETGTPAPYAATLADGRTKRGRMCAACGTRLWGEPEGDARIVVVQPGTLDDTSWLHPVAHIWARSAQPWIVFPLDVTVFLEQPAEFRELIELWRERPSAGA
jgi:hypothetical protein